MFSRRKRGHLQVFSESRILKSIIGLWDHFYAPTRKQDETWLIRRHALIVSFVEFSSHIDPHQIDTKGLFGSLIKSGKLLPSSWSVVFDENPANPEKCELNPESLVVSIFLMKFFHPQILDIVNSFVRHWRNWAFWMNCLSQTWPNPWAEQAWNIEFWSTKKIDEWWLNLGVQYGYSSFMMSIYFLIKWCY